mmetsp:Transcript_33734/g.95442  ORF Transcript_33734/g.95442 Transcript_33734/m.95442 type:complete len:82 (-) Transcript_33734:290-535(-)
MGEGHDGQQQPPGGRVTMPRPKRDTSLEMSTANPNKNDETVLQVLQYTTVAFLGVHLVITWVRRRLRERGRNGRDEDSNGR